MPARSDRPGAWDAAFEAASGAPRQRRERQAEADSRAASGPTRWLDSGCGVRPWLEGGADLVQTGDMSTEADTARGVRAPDPGPERDGPDHRPASAAAGSLGQRRQRMRRRRRTRRGRRSWLDHGDERQVGQVEREYVGPCPDRRPGPRLAANEPAQRVDHAPMSALGCPCRTEKLDLAPAAEGRHEERRKVVPAHVVPVTGLRGDLSRPTTRADPLLEGLGSPLDRSALAPPQVLVHRLARPISARFDFGRLDLGRPAAGSPVAGRPEHDARPSCEPQPVSALERRRRHEPARLQPPERPPRPCPPPRG